MKSEDFTLTIGLVIVLALIVFVMIYDLNFTDKAQSISVTEDVISQCSCCATKQEANK